MNRRGFLGAILAAGVAPAAIGSGILMPVRLVEPVAGLAAPMFPDCGKLTYMGVPVVFDESLDTDGALEPGQFYIGAGECRVSRKGLCEWLNRPDFPALFRKTMRSCRNYEDSPDFVGYAPGRVHRGWPA